MIKKIICCFGAICLLLWSGVPAQAQENVPEPSVSAASAILIEAETGRVLFSKMRRNSGQWPAPQRL